MKQTVLIVLLALALVACGETSAATGEQTIRTYADTMKAGDLTKARTLLSNTSIDWKETNERMLDHGVASYAVENLAQNEIGYTATIRWTMRDDSKPFCSYVRVRRDTGALEMVKDGTYICSDAVPTIVQ